jgi:nitrogen fixation NifU-like protein
MTDKLDAFLDDLQERIFDEAKEAYGQRGFDRWRNPKFHGRIDSPDAHAKVTGTCGDAIEIFLKFKNDRVTEASYLTNGCASSGISGSFAAELAIGKDPDELAMISGAEVLAAIGSLPEEDRHCATLAANTLQEALGNFMRASRENNRSEK